MGYEVEDIGTHSAASTDYPDYAHPLAAKVESGEAKRGMLLCGTGLGMSYAANRHAMACARRWLDAGDRHLRAQHNDANVLVLPARFVSEDDADAILETWLETPVRGRPP
jgi:ribose 5-phosphate isomerase B